MPDKGSKKQKARMAKQKKAKKKGGCEDGHGCSDDRGCKRKFNGVRGKKVTCPKCGSRMIPKGNCCSTCGRRIY